MTPEMFRSLMLETEAQVLQSEEGQAIFKKQLVAVAKAVGQAMAEKTFNQMLINNNKKNTDEEIESFKSKRYEHGLHQGNTQGLTLEHLKEDVAVHLVQALKSLQEAEQEYVKNVESDFEKLTDQAKDAYNAKYGNRDDVEQSKEELIEMILDCLRDVMDNDTD